MKTKEMEAVMEVVVVKMVERVGGEVMVVVMKKTMEVVIMT